MNCEGCEREVGDLKALKTHRKGCSDYKTWAERGAKPIPRIEPQRHVYDGREIPTRFA